MDCNAKIGNRISTLRLERGMSTRTAANLMGMSEHAYLMLELDRLMFTPERVAKAAAAFGVSAMEILEPFSETRPDKVKLSGAGMPVSVGKTATGKAFHKR